MPTKTKSAKQKVVVSLKAPEASTVQVAGDFTGWEQAPVALKMQKGGVWKVTLTLEPGRYEYRFLVDGAWHDDPGCEVTVANAFGSTNCVLVVG